MVIRSLLLLGTFLLFTADLSAQPAKEPDAKKLEQVVEHLASKFILENHFEKFKGEAIEIFAERLDWPLNWRLASTMAIAYAEVIKEPIFKELLTAKLEAEVRTNAASLGVAKFFGTYVKAKARSAEITDGVKGARETRMKTEININKSSASAEKMANVAQVISLLEAAASKELEGSRNKVKDALRQALKDDPTSLNTFLGARATAEKEETAELREAKDNLTKLLEKASKK